MKRLLGLFVFTMLVATAPDDAMACWIAGPMRPLGPAIPAQYDALVIGTFVGNAPAFGGRVWVDEQIYGRTRQTSFSIFDHGDDEISEDGRTIRLGCARRYVFHPGQRILLSLSGPPGAQSVVTWTPLDFAAQTEPFIARYLQTRGRSARQRLVREWREAQTPAQ